MLIQCGEIVKILGTRHKALVDRIWAQSFSKTKTIAKSIKALCSESILEFIEPTTVHNTSVHEATMK
jgi:hypothetical protein